MLRLITSGAYVEQELSAEFGQIPPSFLPIGVLRLYELQVAKFDTADQIYMTIPESFVPQRHDRLKLCELGVTLIPVPEGLRLGESIVYAINYIAAPSGLLQILHGDTLIEELPKYNTDNIAIHIEGDDYSWAAVDLDGDDILKFEEIVAGTGHDGERPVACGYFAFSNSSMLVRAITRAQGDFIGGLNIYIQDHKTRAIYVENWRDFGHIQTYFRSRQTINSARSFNTIKVDAYTVHKSSDDHHKIGAESAWFRSLPPSIQPYSARILESGSDQFLAYYKTEYQYAPTLSELFVLSSIGRPTWRNILRSCQEFLDACAAYKGTGSGDAALIDLAVDKTMLRLERFASETGFDIDKETTLDGRPLPSLRRVAERISAAIDFKTDRLETIMHGDFCFSNILYNSRAGRISVIDPRGYVRIGTLSSFGDTRYDLAKLSHSVVGYYDSILAGRYTLQQDGHYRFSIRFDTSQHHIWLQQTVGEMQVDGIAIGSTTIRAITVGLFLSMLPLHSDRPDRQAAFIANSLRLYFELEGALM